VARVTEVGEAVGIRRAIGPAEEFVPAAATDGAAAKVRQT